MTPLESGVVFGGEALTGVACAGGGRTGREGPWTVSVVILGVALGLRGFLALACSMTVLMFWVSAARSSGLSSR